MAHILCSLRPNYRIDQNYQVGKAFAFQSVAMNLGTLCWPVGFLLFVCLFFLPYTKQNQRKLAKYQPVSSDTDSVPSSTTYNSSFRKAQSSQLINFSFYDSFDESRTVYLV